MACEDLRLRPLEHLRVLDGLLDGGEDAEFRGDRDVELSVQGVDCIKRAVSVITRKGGEGKRQGKEAGKGREEMAEEGTPGT